MIDEGATTVLIPHVDDVACAKGANDAMFELPAGGVVTCGSVMVPPAWFPDAAARATSADVDLGVHLTLTSESWAFRWSPISTSDPASGLIDQDGYMWPTVPALRHHGHPDAVDRELRAQIERALHAGIDVTHLDHHMGAALAPEFVARTAGIAQDYSLPVLFPADIDGYVAALEMGTVDMRALADTREALARDGLAVADTFLMGLTYQDEPDTAATMRRELAALKPGVTYLSLHCAQAGDIDAIHPKDSHWRVAEFALFRDAEFAAWVRGLPVEIRGMRHYRDAVRATR
ncbi:MAG: ChbG/HpnK family deacetylase [Acidimicrobiia bacterium]|nr:ChbG/HpnK family deacetylase [Acidimicrobiia bacterium]